METSRVQISKVLIEVIEYSCMGDKTVYKIISNIVTKAISSLNADVSAMCFQFGCNLLIVSMIERTTDVDVICVESRSSQILK